MHVRVRAVMLSVMSGYIMPAPWLTGWCLAGLVMEWVYVTVFIVSSAYGSLMIPDLETGWHPVYLHFM